MTSTAAITTANATQDEQEAFAEIEHAVDFLADALYGSHNVLITGDVKRGVRFYTNPPNCKGRHMGGSLADPSRASVGALVVSMRATHTMKQIAAEVGLSVSTCRRLINEALLADQVGEALEDADAVTTTAVAAA
jgi:AraC-like DNA-binding protein